MLGFSVNLPVKLAKEPLIEAVFEMRFESGAPLSSMLPGILYSQLGTGVTMEQLPLHSLPKELRDNDPNFLYAPLCKISWENNWALVGDKIFAVATKLPYRGWENLKASIIQASTIVLQTGMISSVSRCSLKYVDLLDGVPLEPSECFNLDLSIGGRSAKHNNFHVSLGVQDRGIAHTIQIFSRASASLFDGREVNGPLIDVDSVMSFPSEPPFDFLASLGERTELLHTENKKVIFSSISESAIKYLEPTYA